jgi:hypothetical protein
MGATDATGFVESQNNSRKQGFGRNGRNDAQDLVPRTEKLRQAVCPAKIQRGGPLPDHGNRSEKGQPGGR